MQSRLTRLTPLHSENVDKSRNVILSKMGLFTIFRYTFTLNCVTRRKMPIEYIFCFICNEQCMKIISLCKKCSLISSVFKKIIPNNTTPTFQEVDGVS